MNTVAQLLEPKKYLVISFDMQIPNSADMYDNCGEAGLYGHSDVKAFAEIKYLLVPGFGHMYPELYKEPQVVINASAFYQDQDGGDHERDVELSDADYELVKAEALKYARSVKSGLKIIKER